MNPLGRRRSIVISALLIGTMFCGSRSVAQEQREWSRGFIWTVSKTTGAFRFLLFNVNQDEHKLTGQFLYENYFVDNETRQSVIIDGTKTSDGRFWPDVAYAIKKDAHADWELLQPPQISGERARMAVAPSDIKHDLFLVLEPFKSFIGKYEAGRVILPTGDAAQFELKLLTPRQN